MELLARNIGNQISVDFRTFDIEGKNAVGIIQGILRGVDDGINAALEVEVDHEDTAASTTQVINWQHVESVVVL